MCIVGSGAGGSVAAAEIAKSGHSVLILDSGYFYKRSEFKCSESEMNKKLYQEGGSKSTIDGAINILQGKSVGGGTTVNLGTCTRTSGFTLEHWEQHYGLGSKFREGLDESFASVEERLNVHGVDETSLSNNGKILLKGARALNLHKHILKRNVMGCAKLGYCSMGCPTNAKLGMVQTFLADAIVDGANLIEGCHVDRIVHTGRTMNHIEATLRSKTSGETTRIVVAPKKALILSAGAINTPALLMKSNIMDDYNLTGKRTFLHPMVIGASFFDEQIDPFTGIPQEVSVDVEKTPDHMGYFIETVAAHPRVSSVALGGYGDSHMKRMQQIRNLHVMDGHLIDGFDANEVCGTVKFDRQGKVGLDYQFSNKFWRSAKDMMKVMVQLGLAAGAKEAITVTENVKSFKSLEDISSIEEGIDGIKLGPNRLFMASAHQMGGCPMGTDEKSSVVNERLMHRKINNLFVMDGSIFPTSIGANPQLSIMGIVHKSIQQIL